MIGPFMQWQKAYKWRHKTKKWSSWHPLSRCLQWFYVHSPVTVAPARCNHTRQRSDHTRSFLQPFSYLSASLYHHTRFKLTIGTNQTCSMFSATEHNKKILPKQSNFTWRFQRSLLILIKTVAVPPSVGVPIVYLGNLRFCISSAVVLVFQDRFSNVNITTK